MNTYLVDGVFVYVTAVVQLVTDEVCTGLLLAELLAFEVVANNNKRLFANLAPPGANGGSGLTVGSLASAMRRRDRKTMDLQREPQHQ